MLCIYHHVEDTLEDRVGERAPCYQFVALVEDWGLVLSTHIEQFADASNSSSRDAMPSSGSVGICSHMDITTTPNTHMYN